MEIEKRIIDLLKKIDMKINFLGFKYWKTAILYRLNHCDSNMEEVYVEVKTRHKTTRNRVEKNLRYALENSKVKEFFDVDYKITNSVFLSLACEELKTNSYS